jgi:hypothetical protein
MDLTQKAALQVTMKSYCYFLLNYPRISELDYKLFWTQVKPKVKVEVTLRLTIGQSASLGVEPHLGLMTRYLLLFDSYGLVFVGRPL